MNYVTCIVPVAPLREEAAHRSQMTSQLLFGECATVLQSTNDFMQIKSLYDGYEGWCQSSQLIAVDESFATKNQEKITADAYNTILLDNKKMILPQGCFLGAMNDELLQIGKQNFEYKGNCIVFEKLTTKENLLNIAEPYLNTAYLWGGKSILGIDCSGFVQQVYKMLRIVLPRDAYQQALVGESVGFLEEVKLGDLAFFDNAEGRITHVGIMLNPHQIIHASGKVRMDKIDNMGIVNSDTQQRTHQLRIIKRVGD
jgi:hypothetical protein